MTATRDSELDADLSPAAAADLTPPNWSRRTR